MVVVFSISKHVIVAIEFLKKYFSCTTATVSESNMRTCNSPFSNVFFIVHMRTTALFLEPIATHVCS